MKVIILFLCILNIVNADTHIVYHNNLNQDNYNFGSCISGSKNAEEVIEIETKSNQYFSCQSIASSLDSEFVECNHIFAPADGSCSLCTFLKKNCDNTYYGKWTLNLESNDICSKC